MSPALAVNVFCCALTIAGLAQRVVSEERAQRISRARTSRSEAYRLAQRASSAAAQAQRDAAVCCPYPPDSPHAEAFEFRAELAALPRSHSSPDSLH
jgi:hypothetical protein